MSDEWSSLIIDAVGIIGVILLVTGVGLWSVPASLVILGLIGILLWIGALGASRRQQR
jgi:hypothetical protein